MPLPRTPRDQLTSNLNLESGGSGPFLLCRLLTSGHKLHRGIKESEHLYKQHKAITAGKDCVLLVRVIMVWLVS
jgi:hypothetical protein